MCVLFLAVNQHPHFPLIIAANRDEIYARPTTSSQFWPSHPDILAGQDQEAGGTWMGITRSGYFSALTNIRAPSQPRIETRTRGELVSQYLQETPSNAEFSQRLRHNRQRYRGYNLIFGHWQDLQVYNNYNDQVLAASAGFYGLSNAALNSPWHKVSAGVRELTSLCQSMDNIDHEALFELLRNDTRAADEYLPNTGMPESLEKQLSSIFIHLPDYGTRSSTIVTVNREQQVHWVERTYNANAQVSNEQRYQFAISAPSPRHAANKPS